jgi:deferrochelatase/peroxidase EfeB
MQFSQVDYRDIQGLVRFGHAHLPEAVFCVAQIVDSARARQWIRDSVADVTQAVAGAKPRCAMQIAFTFDGLRALGVPRQVLEGFSHEFQVGMVESSRSRRLGDVGSNDPKCWEWGVPGESCPHVLVMIYAEAGTLGARESALKGKRWSAAFRDLQRLSTRLDEKDREPFGFVDGVSQPWVDWNGRRQVRQPPTTEYTNVSALGEFLLGYPNEYGYYTDRPLLDSKDDPAGLLPLAEDKPGKRDLGRNGTYLVLRDLAQDVDGFAKFVDDVTKPNAREALELKTAISGRVPADTPIIPPRPDNTPPWPNVGAVDDPKWVIPPGGPAMPLCAETIGGVGPKMKDIWLDQFTFRNDPDGTACPYGAHIRRANPRNADFPQDTRGLLDKFVRLFGFRRRHPHEDVLSSTRFHRIMRRGRAYGDPDKGEGRGLRFVCLGANIARQFEFIQTSWLANPKFSSLDEDDPLVGAHPDFMMAGADPNQPVKVETNILTRPQDNGIPCRVHGLRQFVTVNGGAYFFMPSIGALRYIAADPIQRS